MIPYTIAQNHKQWHRINILSRPSPSFWYMIYIIKNILATYTTIKRFPGGSAGKECGRPGFDPWVGKIPWRREQLPTLDIQFWPGEFHGLYSPWVHKELDMTEWLSHSLTHAANSKSSLLPGCVIVPCTYMSSPGPHKEEMAGQGIPRSPTKYLLLTLLISVLER